MCAFAHSDIGLGGGCQSHGAKDAPLPGKVSHDSADFGEFWATALEVERLLVPQLRAGQHSLDVGTRAGPKMHKPLASIANTTLRSPADWARSSDEHALSSSSNSVMEERELQGVRESVGEYLCVRSTNVRMLGWSTCQTHVSICSVRHMYGTLSHAYICLHAGSYNVGGGNDGPALACGCFGARGGQPRAQREQHRYPFHCGGSTSDHIQRGRCWGDIAP